MRLGSGVRSKTVGEKPLIINPLKEGMRVLPILSNRLVLGFAYCPAILPISITGRLVFFSIIVARRLLERGVRFIQIWSGNDNGFPRRNWDSHEDIRRDHGPLARGMARGTAALILDLKQRGMLEDTLILWTTEFGRMPCAQGSKGRDHNPFVFTNWLAVRDPEVLG